MTSLQGLDTRSTLQEGHAQRPMQLSPLLGPGNRTGLVAGRGPGRMEDQEKVSPQGPV